LAVDAAQRNAILTRYREHSTRFEAVAARRDAGADVIPFQGPLRELEQEPTMREVEVLQLICDGLVNREIGVRLFLSEETVKSHVRHILAKLQARSRAHAVGRRLPPRHHRLGRQTQKTPAPADVLHTTCR